MSQPARFMSLSRSGVRNVTDASLGLRDCGTPPLAPEPTKLGKPEPWDAARGDAARDVDDVARDVERVCESRVGSFLGFLYWLK